MPSPYNISNIPAPRVDFIDPRTGLMAREWYRFFFNLFNLTGGGTTDTSLADLQVGPPAINEVLGQLGITYDQAQLASMMAQYEQATRDLQNQFENAPALPQLGTLSAINEDNVRMLGFSQAPSPTPGDAPGVTYWDDGSGTLVLGLKGGNVTYFTGQQEFARCYNDTALSMTKGQVVYISGAQGNRIAVKLAQADSDANSAHTIGFVAETIEAGKEGWVQISGPMYKLNTLGLTAGDTVYLSPTIPGAWTTTKPVAPNHLVIVGFVERVSSTVGSIFIKVDNGYELEELHNVKITSVANGDLLQYDSTGPFWKNVPLSSLSIGTATNLAGGAAGSVPYQSAASTTTFLPVGTAGQVLQVNAGATAPEWVNSTGTGSVVRATSPSLTTPSLGAATATSINNLTLTQPATSATLTIADGKTLTASNTLTFTGTDGSSVAFGTGGTVAYTSNNLGVFAATTSAQLAGVISDETGSGSLVFNTSPTLATPTFTTSATGPLLIGGTGTTSTLTLRATSGIGTTGSDIVFQVGNNGATEAMRIIDTGKVGVGISAPTSNSANTVHVHGATSELHLTNTTTGATATDGFCLQMWSDSIAYLIQRENAAMAFYTNNLERMRILAGGNVGIGTASPAQRLDVNGSLAIAGTTLSDSSRNVTAATVNKVTITAPATSATLTIADGKTLTVSDNATVSGTNTGDQTITLTGDVTGSGTGSFATTIAAASTGTGNLVRANSPTLVTPALGTPSSGNFSTGTFTWPTFNQNTTGSAGSVANSVTFDNSGTGAVSGTTYNGSAARTISYNTIGAQPTLVSGSNIRTVGGVNLLGSGDIGTIDVIYGGTGNSAIPTAGQIPIGNGTNFTFKTISAGTNITILNGSGNISISSKSFVGSVDASFTGGIVSVTGGPIINTGTLAFTVAGTSGGIPYFSSASTWASSGVLAANALVVGGGAGLAPATITTGTGVVTALGVNTGSAGAFVVNGGALGTPSSGTLTNCTGLPISTGVSGLGTGIATFLATPSSANLAAAVTGETGSGALVFGSSPTIDAPTISGITNLTGGQIQFPATQVSSADANTLDDYDEGTWTATIIGTTTAGTGTYTTQVGRYTKIGRVVHVNCRLVWTAHTGTGNMQISGLPFACENVAGSWFGVSFGQVSNIALTAGNVMTGYIQNNTSVINLQQYPTGGGASAAVPLDTAGTLVVSATYQAAT